MLAAGKLRERVTLQCKQVTRDALGGESVEWPAVDSVWAAAEPLRGREFFSAQQVHQGVTVRFRLRYRRDVLEGEWRLVWQGRTYNPVSPPIDVGGRGVELEILCESAVRDDG